MKGILLLLMAAVSVLGQSDSLKAEYARFEGTWSFALVEVDGVKQPEAPFATNKIIIRRDGTFVVVQGPRVTRGILNLNPTTTPKHFDFSATEADGKSITTLGIYKFDGDTYTVCASLREGERPASLENLSAKGLICEVLQREKQSVQSALAELDAKPK